MIFVDTIDIIIRIARSGNQDMIEHVYKVVRAIHDRMLESRDGTDCPCRIIPFPIPKKRRAGRERIGNQNRKAI